MAYGDCWVLDQGLRGTAVLMEVVLRLHNGYPLESIVNAMVVTGEVFYLNRTLGPGEIGPFIPEESDTVRRVRESA